MRPASTPPSAVAVEPSVANNGKVMLVTYNRYAAQSLDYGSTWSYINPALVYL